MLLQRAVLCLGVGQKLSQLFFIVVGDDNGGRAKDVVEGSNGATEELVMGGVDAVWHGNESSWCGVAAGAVASLIEGPATGARVPKPFVDGRDADGLDESLGDLSDGCVTGGVVSDKRRREVGGAAKIFRQDRGVGNGGAFDMEDNGGPAKGAIPESSLETVSKERNVRYGAPRTKSKTTC